jgi:hypothetical protein
MMDSSATKTKRFTSSPASLLLEAIGGPRAAAAKAQRFGRAVAGYVKGSVLDQRLRTLAKKGLIEEIPTRAQLVAGGFDMLRFWIAPASAEYYREQGIDFTFHQVLRFLDEPASLLDPVGFFSTRDAIIGHLMQVVHANPVYDLELLQMWDDGLDELEAQIEAMLDGSHPRAASIGAIVEEPDYHANLLRFVRAFRKDPTIPPLLRSNVGAHATWSDLERTFGALRTAMRYFRRLPERPGGALHHMLTVKAFPAELAEPAASPPPG